MLKMVDILITSLRINKHIFMCTETLHCTHKYTELLSRRIKYNFHHIGSFEFGSVTGS